jgi:hypothetical protein
MSRDTLTAFADAVLQQVRDANAATGEGSFLVSLPAYLDAAEVRLLQMEVNRWAVIDVELRHRLGERRVEVRLVRSRLRR